MRRSPGDQKAPKKAAKKRTKNAKAEEQTKIPGKAKHLQNKGFAPKFGEAPGSQRESKKTRKTKKSKRPKSFCRHFLGFACGSFLPFGQDAKARKRFQFEASGLGKATTKKRRSRRTRLCCEQRQLRTCARDFPKRRRATKSDDDDDDDDDDGYDHDYGHDRGDITLTKTRSC